MAVIANKKNVALEYAPHGTSKIKFSNHSPSINKHQISLRVHALKINPPNLNKIFWGDALVSYVLL